MRNKGKHGPFFRAFVFLAALIVLAVVLAVGVFYYVFAIPEPDGLSLASWPDRFTDNFSLWMHSEAGTISVEEIGVRRLDEYKSEAKRS